MAIPKKVQTYLEKRGLKADVVEHKTVFTVFDLAQTLREKFDAIAKTLLVKADKDYFLVVMPANYRLDIPKFKKALQAKKVTLASEKDMKNKFKTKPGAMLPFGTLHKVEVVMDKSLLKTKQALFSAGSFTESLRMKVNDYVDAVEPHIESIAKKVPMKLHVVSTKTKKKKQPAKTKTGAKRKSVPKKRKRSSRK